MITEDYVSFESAKLLKEKGFDGKCDYLYVDGKLVRALGCACNWNDGDTLFADYKNECSAPTLQMTTKWLREVHHLFIGCEPRLSFTDFYWITANIYRVRKKSSLYHTEDVDDYNCVACCDSHSYEEAYESAIKYCLENLI